jgi:hypothetical protein
MIRRDDLASRRRDERLANAPAFAGAHRNVLQVRVIRCQAPGYRHGLRVIRVHAACLRVDHARQLVGVGRLQFRQATVFQQDLRQRIVFGELLQHFFVGGRRAAGCLLDHRELQLLEEDLPDLLRRAEVEFAAGEQIGFRLQFDQASRDLSALHPQFLAIDQYAIALHLAQDS